jgi:hypothetical protein
MRAAHSTPSLRGRGCDGLVLKGQAMKLPILRVIQDGSERKFHGSWYRGKNTNFMPSKADLTVPNAIERYVLQGWLPNAPFIAKRSRITSVGSCFAVNVTRYLHQRGYQVMGHDWTVHNSHIIRFGEGMVNSFAIRQQIEWGLEGKPFPEGLWFGQDKEIALPDEAVRRDTEAILRSTDVFIITLGLSEIWYDKVSGEAFWRAIPASLFDEKRHSFRVSTIEENRENISAIHSVIRKHRPDAHLVFTLSPVPLVATFRPISCITASSVSKAILRVALDEFLRQTEDSGVHYFPSYEIIKEVVVDAYEADNRHPRKDVIASILQTFERYYCFEDAVEDEAVGGHRPNE